MSEFRTNGSEPFSHIGRVVKRFTDVAASLAVLFLVFPVVFVIVACCIKITMKGPVFFRQKRTGMNGRVFTCYKFRTLDIVKGDDGTEHEIRYRFGDFMRVTGIDELPQFWNVLIGDMSIVGPRPHMLSHDEAFARVIPYYNKRYAVRPGITGLAQVKGYRGTCDAESVRLRVDCDLWYIAHQSLLLDIKIALKTAFVMIKACA